MSTILSLVFLGVTALFISPQAMAAEGLCLPATAEARAWPVCGIYMHGLFGSPSYPPSTWEVPFRNSLSQIGREKRCRIAAPFGNVGRNRNWNGVSIESVRSRAAAVCGSPLAARPDIIGFSNGANVLRKQTCATLRGFTRVTLIGPTGTTGNSRVVGCGNVTIIQRHAVPPLATLRQAINHHTFEQDEWMEEPAAEDVSEDENLVPLVSE